MSFHAKCVTCMLVRFIKMSDYFQNTQNEESNTCFHTNKSFVGLASSTDPRWFLPRKHFILWHFKKETANTRPRTVLFMAKQEEWSVIYEHWGAWHQMTVHCKCQWWISFMQIQNFLLFVVVFVNFYLFPYSGGEKLNHQSGWWMNKALFISWGLVFSNNTAYLQNYTAFKKYIKQLVTYNQRLIDNKDNKER